MGRSDEWEEELELNVFSLEEICCLWWVLRRAGKLRVFVHEVKLRTMLRWGNVSCGELEHWKHAETNFSMALMWRPTVPNEFHKGQSLSNYFIYLFINIAQIEFEFSKPIN
jgi:hypothetical protein